jgi:hypothetical protein
MNGMFRAYDMLVDHLAHIDEAIKQMGKNSTPCPNSQMQLTLLFPHTARFMTT